MGRVEFDFRLNIRPLLRQLGVARKLGVRPRNYIGAFRLMRSLLGGRGVEANDKVPLQDYVSRFTDDDMVHLFINCLSQLYFALSYRQASAGEFIWCFSRMFNEASFGYPAGGSGPDSWILHAGTGESMECSALRRGSGPHLYREWQSDRSGDRLRAP